jgi:hypothetical protein
MKLIISASECDTSTLKIAEALRLVFQKFEDQLSGNYDGVIEHLWIDLELSEMSFKAFGKPPKPFRFQKRVSGAGHMGLSAIPDSYNVGHYSVRPDFEILKKNTIEQSVSYIIGLIYQSTEMLLDKQKRLSGFNAVDFRDKFLSVAISLGFNIGDE